MSYMPTSVPAVVISFAAHLYMITTSLKKATPPLCKGSSDLDAAISSPRTYHPPNLY